MHDKVISLVSECQFYPSVRHEVAHEDFWLAQGTSRLLYYYNFACVVWILYQVCMTKFLTVVLLSA